MMISANSKIQETKSASRAVANAIVQPKLNVSTPGDRYEVEADRAAAHVVNRISNNSPEVSTQQKESGDIEITRLQRQEEEEETQMKFQRQAEEEEETIQAKVQRQTEEEEEAIQAKVQRQTEEEEETIQTKVQRQAEEEEEEEIQPKLQRQAEEEEEETVQTKVQRQTEEEEEEIQTKVQRQAEEEEEEEIQPKLQRQAEEEEETVQTKVQRQAEEEEEEEIQPKLQRQAEEEEEETVQTKVQRQTEEEEEEIQTKVQRQAEEEEEAIQPKVQRQAEEEEEEEIQPKLQRQAEEEEETVQTKVQRQTEEEEEEIQPKLQRQSEEEVAQAKSEARATVKDKLKYPVLNVVEERIIQRRGMGSPLDDQARIEMESGFGADFRKVRIHDDAEAARMASDMNAQAFTTGHDIYFNDGKFDPDSLFGKSLLAHELTHVIQQGQSERKTSEDKIQQNNQNRNASPPQPADHEAQAAANTIEEQKKSFEEEHPEKPDSNTIVVQDDDVVSSKKKKHKGDKHTGLGNPNRKKEANEEEGGQSIGDFLRMDSKGKLNQKISGLNKLADNEQKKDSADKKLEQTQKAVAPPVYENQSRANASQVEQVNQVKEPEPDESKLKENFQESLQKSLPTSLEEADEFKEKGKGREVGEQVRGMVTADTQEVKSTYREIENTPEPQPAETPEVLPPIEVAPETTAIGLGKGTVGKLRDEHTDLSEFETDSDNQIKKEGISEEKLEMVDEGDLVEAREGRKKLKEDVKAAPAAIRKEEQSQKKQVDVHLKKEELQGKKKMRQDRVKALNQARDKQNTTKGSIEQKRLNVTNQINQIYEDANKKVKQKLEDLEKQSLTAFDKGQASATKTFEDNVKRRLDAFKSDRYSGLFGWGRWLKDKLLGMDDLPQVKRIFDSEKATFISTLDRLIGQITNNNKSVILECKTMIADARLKIKEFVSTLGPELMDVGLKAQSEIKEKLDTLDKQVNQKEKELKKKLLKKREAAIKAIEEKIEKMKESMKGLVSKLGNLLLGALVKFLKWAAKKVGLSLDLITKSANVIKTIAKDPVQFFKNLLKAVGLGITQFGDNIRKHLVDGLVKWLFGSFAKEGIQLPENFDLKGVFIFVTEILGLTYENIKKRVIKRIGPKGAKAFELMEKGVAWVKDFIVRGPVALWDWVKKSLANIKDVIMEGIRSFIITKVITEAITWLIGMLNPAGAILKILKIIYQVVKFFIDNMQRIIEFAGSVFKAVGEIASGALGAAAKAIENSLAKTIPIIIGFLASLLGLDGLVKKVVEIIRNIGKRVDKAMNKVIDFLVGKGKKLLNTIKSGAKVVGGKVKQVSGKIKQKLIQWWKTRKKLKTKDGEAHTIFFKGTGASAKLMMASDEMPYAHYISTIKEKHNLKENQLGEPRKLAGQIDSKIKKVTTAKNAEVHGKELNTVVDKLVDATMNIDLGEATGKNTPPLFGPQRQGLGTFVKRVYMQAPLDKKGFRPSVPNTKEFDILNQRRTGGGSLFVKGHLLNENLDGPGNTWSNLTPLTQQANSDHKTQFENPVKLAVNNATSGYSGTTHGYAKNFIVKAMYNREINSGLINNLENDDIESDQIPNMPDNIDPFMLAKILKAEQFVPSSLECSVIIGEKEGNKTLKERTITKPIDNEINHGDLSKYQLSPLVRVNFDLKEKLSVNREASIKHLMTLKLIGPAKAEKLHDKMAESGSIPNFITLIGITKKTLEKANKGYKIINAKA